MKIRGSYKLAEECSEVAAAHLKLQGKLLEGASSAEIDQLTTSLLQEIGDLISATKRLRKRLPKEARRVVNDQIKAKDQRYRRRKLPGIDTGDSR